MDCEFSLKSTLTVSDSSNRMLFFGFPLKRAKVLKAYRRFNDHSAILVVQETLRLQGPLRSRSHAKLLDQLLGTVMAVGDLAYPTAARKYSTVYGQDLGPRKNPHPPRGWAIRVPSTGGTPYFVLFGAAAGDPKTG